MFMITLATLTTLLSSTAFYFGSLVFVLLVLVFVHELGHFLVARWCGVKVITFSIGFGKEIFGFDDRHGTRWRFAWIPLGGYVKFIDDANGTSMPDQTSVTKMTPEERAGSFHAKPLWQRALVVGAGPIANFIFAIIVFALLFAFLGERTTPARVDEVAAGMPAAAAGFRKGDIIREIDGRHVKNYATAARLISSSPGRKISVIVARGDELISLNVIPRPTEVEDRTGSTVTRGIIGVRHVPGPNGHAVNYPGPLESVWLGIKETETIVSLTLGYLADVVTGYQKPDQLGGVVRIADVSGKAAQVGPETLVFVIAVLSISVGLMNLFPIPLLDGGHLLFYALEAVRGKPLSKATQGAGFKIGLAIVGCLMVFAMWNDLSVMARWLDFAAQQIQSQ
jgi:regulator of sigma E protease